MAEYFALNGAALHQFAAVSLWATMLISAENSPRISPWKQTPPRELSTEARTKTRPYQVNATRQITLWGIRVEK